jgi:hypothetical protein
MRLKGAGMAPDITDEAHGRALSERKLCKVCLYSTKFPAKCERTGAFSLVSAC